MMTYLYILHHTTSGRYLQASHYLHDMSAPQPVFSAVDHEMSSFVFGILLRKATYHAVYLSIYPSISSVCLSIYLSIYLHVYMSTCLPTPTYMSASSICICS